MLRSFTPLVSLTSLLWVWFTSSVVVEGDMKWVARVQQAVEIMPSSDREFVMSQHERIISIGCGAYVPLHTTGVDCGFTDPVELGGVLVHEAVHHWDEDQCIAYVGAKSEERALRRQADYLFKMGHEFSAWYIERAIGEHGDKTNSLLEIAPHCKIYYNPQTEKWVELV